MTCTFCDYDGVNCRALRKEGVESLEYVITHGLKSYWKLKFIDRCEEDFIVSAREYVLRKVEI